jgi:hypothetical protein
MANGGGSVASIELFDPASNAVRDLAPMTERRSGHTATLLPDGRVLIAGGYDGEYHASIEVFDPRTGETRPAGSLLEGRSGHTANLLQDGRVLFIGGVGRGWTFLRSAEIYDPATRRSRAVGPMSVPRESHTSTSLTDGRVLVVGGHNGRRQNMEVYASAEVFNPATNVFESVGGLATARHKHDAIRLADGRVLVLAGADRTDRGHYTSTEIFTPETGRFTPGPSLAQRRYKIAQTSILLPGGAVLVTSGARAAELLEPGASAFRAVPGDYPAALHFAAAALLPDGDVFIAGGYSDANQNSGGIWRFTSR